MGRRRTSRCPDKETLERIAAGQAPGQAQGQTDTWRICETDQNVTHRWLKDGRLQAETEGSHGYEKLISNTAKIPGTGSRTSATVARVRMKVVPVVLGSMGMVTDLQKHLMRAELLNQEEVTTLMANVQREVLCGAVRIIKCHIATR